MSPVDPRRGEYLGRLLTGIGELPHALIGGQALLLHGLARQTDDIDLLVADRAVLDAGRWGTGDPPATVRRATDPADPLDGLVTLAPPTDEDGVPSPSAPAAAELVVLDRIWAREILARAHVRGTLAGHRLPVVELADLAILKAYAGGPVDRADVAAMVERPDWTALRATVEQRLVGGPRVAVRNWARWMALLDG